MFYVDTILVANLDSANIWSHLLGALQFLFGLVQFIQLLEATNTSDAAAVGLYYLCVVICFLLSTTYHTLSDHSAEIHRFGNELDHLGIVMVIWGTGISGTHFGFYCDDAQRNAYFLVLTATAVGCAIFTLQPKFRQPTYRTARFLMYCFLGSSMFAPVVHGIVKFGYTKFTFMMGVDSFLGLALINFTGAAVYAARIPERWFPKRFDLFGQSHNWMHILVWTGALVRLDGLLKVLQMWQEQGNRDRLC